VHKPQERRALTGALVVLDSVAIGLGLWLAFEIRLQSGLIPYGSPYDPGAYFWLIAVAVFIWLAIFAGFRLYDPAILLGGAEEYARVVQGCTFGALALMALSFFWRRHFTFSRLWLLLSWGFAILLDGGGRFLFRRLVFWLRRRYGLFITRILVVGANEQGKALARQWSRASGWEVVGFADDFLPPGAPVTSRLKVLSPSRYLARTVRQHAIDEVVVVQNAVAWETFEEIIRQSAQQNSFEIKLAPGYYETATTSVAVVNRGFVPLLDVQHMRITGIDALLKSIVDYIGGALSLLFLWPIALLVAAGLKLTAPGRPLFSRRRVYGVRGRVFTTTTFDVHAAADDPSAGARLRRFLYSLNLDKLPQLVNVLAGQMSLIGPRPIHKNEAHRFHHWLPNLLTVKPGMTDVWPVTNEPCIDDQIRARMHYIRNWTIWLDLQMLYHAMVRVLRRRRPPATPLPVQDVELDGLPRLHALREQEEEAYDGG